VPSPAELQGRADLGDWRVVLGRLEARYRAGSFEGAASFVAQIAAAAETADHHPDIELRYPDVVQVALSTHSVGGLTERDAELAHTISTIASAADVTAQPHASQRVEVAIDAIDIGAVLPFWRAVLAYVDEPPPTDGGQVDAIVDPLRIGPAFWFQQMDGPRTERNRIHVDVSVPHDVAEERIATTIRAGGRLVSDREARAFWVLADAEGNEACVCTWQDRD